MRLPRQKVVQAELLTVEVTESAVDQGEPARKALAQLNKLRFVQVVKIGIDDYGTGYSSLS